MKKFRDLVEKKELVDIYQAIEKMKKDKYAVQDQWPDLLYNGVNIFDIYMKSYDDIKNEIKHAFEDGGRITDFEGGEVYLGYNKKKDKFVSGWDCWITEEIYDFDEDDEDDEDGFTEDGFIEDVSSANATVTFKILNNKIEIIGVMTREGNIFYQSKGNSGYNAIKKNKDIIDIRLD